MIDKNIIDTYLELEESIKKASEACLKWYHTNVLVCGKKIDMMKNYGLKKEYQNVLKRGIKKYYIIEEVQDE